MKSACNGPGTLVLALFVLMAAGLAVGPQAQAADFAYRKPITIDHTKVGSLGASTLTNYPFLYSVTDLNLRSTAQCSPSPCGRVTDTGSSSGSVAIDGVADSNQSGIGRNATTSGSGVAPTINVPHTVAGTNTLLLVGISATTSTFPTLAASNPVVWDPAGTPQPLTSAGFTTGTNSKIWIYYRVNPTAGPKTLQVSFSGGGTVVVGVTSFTGVDQTTPLSIFFGAASNGLTASVNVASAPREVVFDTVAVNAQATSLSVGGGQSSRWDVGTGAAGRGAGSTEPGAGSVTMSWGISVAQDWAIGAVSIKPAGTGITLDVTHTVSGSNRLLMVGISAWATFPTVSSVVWDPAGANQALTLVGSQANSTVAKMWMYSLVAPTLGQKILRVTFAATTNAVVGVMSFTGVSQAIPYSAFRSGADSGGTSDPTHLIVPSATGELVFETIAVESYQSLTIDNSPPWSTTNTLRWN